MREGLQKIVELNETIVAVSTVLGRSAIGVVRVSGGETLRIISLHFSAGSPVEPRRTTLGSWRDEKGEPLDEVLVTFFQSPNSYTGEDLVEISAHGNPIILNRIVQCIRSAGARLAGPGEFTLRAVANGKMDLTQAEAVREFIEAQTEQQARVALRQMEGAASKRLGPAKRELVDVIAHLEAGIDFAEDDVEVPQAKTLAGQVNSIVSRLTALQETFGYGRMLVAGLRVTILGKPNVGKSSLFNRLLATERAIVTEIPGTTRDVLTEALNLDGIPLRLADTAGLRETTDYVESIGVSRSLESLAEADLALIVLDGSQPLDNEDENVLVQSRKVPHLVVINKSDLPQVIHFRSNGTKAVNVSAVAGSGLEELRVAIREFVMDRKSDFADDFVLTNARQHEALVRATDSLRTASTAVLNGVPHEMVLLDLYAALSAIGEITGEVVNEDILDRIFSTFCVGK